MPTLLYLLPQTNASLLLLSRTGLALAACVLVLGAANKLMLAALWIIYMSIVNVGQIWFGFGWEMLLLEVGFLSIFTSPTLRVSQFPSGSPLPCVVRWMYRWLLYRLIMGAGLIKIRGDEVRSPKCRRIGSSQFTARNRNPFRVAPARSQRARRHTPRSQNLAKT